MLNELRQRSLHEWPANPATVAAASATSTTELSPSSGGSHFQGTLFWTFGGQNVSDNLFGSGRHLHIERAKQTYQVRAVKAEVVRTFEAPAVRSRYQ
jgi:hypothetical protein